MKDRERIQVLIDGKPIKNLKSFSIDVSPEDIDPVYTVKQYMVHPYDDDEYNGNNYYRLGK